jgi:bifunctional non-homologous end joining protein LigD
MKNPRLPRFQPMPLARRSAPFDDPRWIYELKWDGFRSLAYVSASGAVLVSRTGHTYRQFGELCDGLVLDVNADEAVLDGELVCLDQDGRPLFNELLFRHGFPSFVAFDVLWANGKDLRERPLLERKDVLRAIVPEGSPFILYAQHLNGRGREFFSAVCATDLEGIVAKRGSGLYRVIGPSTWVKIKNPEYSQARDRHELFERRNQARACLLSNS